MKRSGIEPEPLRADYRPAFDRVAILTDPLNFDLGTISGAQEQGYTIGINANDLLARKLPGEICHRADAISQSCCDEKKLAKYFAARLGDR